MMCRGKSLLTAVVLWVSSTMSSNVHAVEPESATPVVEGADAFEAREFKSGDGGVLRYRLLKPLGYDNPTDKTAKLPLVLFLHGAGERGDENVRQLIHGGKTLASEELRQRHPAFVVAPQCPEKKRWVEVDWDADSHTMPAEPSESLRRVFELLEALQGEFSIDKSRIYAVGLSMGGYGTWDILQRQPGLLAAAAPICGGGDPARAGAFVETPVWAFHGADDTTVKPERSRQMIEALKAGGGRPIYTEYEGVGHNSWTQTFENRLMWDWLFAQRRN
jgi:predicted peptidase